MHFGHSLCRLAPHSPQNFISSGFSNWHLGHLICDLPGHEVQLLQKCHVMKDASPDATSGGNLSGGREDQEQEAGVYST